jgi:hypothetical protein
MMRILLAASCAVLLGACGASREDLSFEVCAESARDSTQRSRAFTNDQKRSFAIDKAASLATVREVEPGVTELRLIATIDDAQGKPSGQDVLCRTRFNEGADKPDVIAFTLLLEGQ